MEITAGTQRKLRLNAWTARLSKWGMQRAQVQVPWKKGLHLRPATALVRMAQSFPGKILLKCGDRLADARSIVSVLLLAASMGSVLDVEISGDDEASAASAIEHIFTVDECSPVQDEDV